MNYNKIAGMLLACACSSYSSAQLIQMPDNDLAEVRGQALLTLTQTAGTSPVDNAAMNFYKLGAEALIEINANIKRLQLGCGGVNGASGCDIDIENLAISGLNDGTDATGSPTFANGRSSTSAQIKNPFIEFAVKNPTSQSTREMIGFRLGAQEIIGLLTLGTDNTLNPSDGIRSFSGYMKLAQTTGSIMTQQAIFADRADRSDGLDRPAKLTALGTTTEFYTDPSDAGNRGLTIPSSPATFTLPETTVNVQRRSTITLNNIPARVDYIPLAPAVGAPEGIFANDQVYTRFYEPICVNIIITSICDSDAYYKPSNGSYLSNLNVLVTSLSQNLNQIHNIPLTGGSGGYISLQKENVRWNGANSDDIAQRGWWMSFNNAIQLGQLVGSDLVDVSSVFPQIADAVSEYLGDNPVQPENALDALGSNPTRSLLQINLQNYTNGAVGSANGPALMTLGSQRFRSQEVAPNCYGNLKFC